MECAVNANWYIHTYVASKSGVKFPNIDKSLREFLLNRALYVLWNDSLFVTVF